MEIRRLKKQGLPLGQGDAVGRLNVVEAEAVAENQIALAVKRLSADVLDEAGVEIDAGA